MLHFPPNALGHSVFLFSEWKKQEKCVVVFNKNTCCGSDNFNKKRDLIAKNMTEHLTIASFHGMIVTNPKTSATHRVCEFFE
jgi:hypothetical protein